ncbi:hypothetical protein BJX64DRAFT_290465 [Aspergillus heterothallicus]
MCFFWAVEHVPECLLEWIRQLLTIWFLQVAICFYDIGIAVIFIVVVWIFALLFVPVCFCLMVRALVEELYTSMVFPVLQYIGEALEQRVPRPFLLPYIWGWKVFSLYCWFWWEVLNYFLAVWWILTTYVSLLLEWVFRC